MEKMQMHTMNYKTVTLNMQMYKTLKTVYYNYNEVWCTILAPDFHTEQLTQ